MLAAVLAEHRHFRMRDHDDRQGWHGWCTPCGEEVDAEAGQWASASEWHRAHVAAALDAALAQEGETPVSERWNGTSDHGYTQEGDQGEAVGDDRPWTYLTCSQCGEQPSAMVKIGTDDGWCTACLDDAADHEGCPPKPDAGALAAAVPVAGDDEVREAKIAAARRELCDTSHGDALRVSRALIVLGDGGVDLLAALDRDRRAPQPQPEDGER